MSLIKIDYVEIGFRFLDKVKTKGPCAYSEETFLRSLKIPKNLNFVLHQASLTSVQESLEKPASYLNQNVLSYIKLVEILKTTKIKFMLLIVSILYL